MSFLKILSINWFKIWEITSTLALDKSYNIRDTVQLIPWIFSPQKTFNFAKKFDSQTKK